MTIRLRLTLWYSSLLVGITTIFSIAVFGILDRTLRMQVDQNLMEVLDKVAADVQDPLRPSILVDSATHEVIFIRSPNLEPLTTSDVSVQIWELGDTRYPFSQSLNLGMYHAPLDLRGLRSDEETRANVAVGDTRMRVITRPIIIQGQIVGHIQAATTLETIVSATDRLLRILVIEGVVALLLSFVLGNWLAQRVLHPVSNITRTAEQIAVANDLNQRIPYDGPQDEIGHLITTFNHMVERLEKLFNAQQRFVADVSHELRTPVTAIQGHVELLQRIGNDPASLDAILSETQRMSRLIGDLLTLARADVGSLPLEQTQVQLDTLLLEVYNQARILSQGRVRIVLGELDQVIVKGDPDRLRQLLINLMTNAVKYTPEGGEIKLSLLRSPRWVEVMVADTGSGIPAEDLPFIFDRFYRVHKARSRQDGGTGLGLSIAKWIAEAHKGTLTVQSTLNVGTTFTLRLPLPEMPAGGSSSPDAITRPHLPVLRLIRPRPEEETPAGHHDPAGPEQIES